MKTIDLQGWLDKLPLNPTKGLMIRHKLWGTFILFMVFFLIVVTTTIINMKKTEHTMNAVVKNAQPMVLLSLNLKAKVAQAGESLGFYLLSQEESHKDKFLVSMDELTDLVKPNTPALAVA